MKINLKTNNPAAAITSAKRVQSVLDRIDGELVITTDHNAIVTSEYTQANNFFANAAKYGMLVKATGEGTQKRHVWRKTGEFPEFIAPEISESKRLQLENQGRGRGAKRTKPDTDSQRQVATYSSAKQRANAAKSSVKQGDGSVLKPKFNHAISPANEPKTYVYYDRYQPSRLGIMNEIEDKGGYQHHMHQPQSTGRVFSNKGRY
ncbi:hypothetical protein HQN60_12485 [Deefgea piscis]|uniref:Uncharacterized protein n=1 Tax=Deefgea piscis TaxID=2739061 RepID=A0A6M8SQH0_9NEIS|nr:hypothetical protein [Deefgea piscis]QKJ67455.1 hypothetical protein HQN60_12485 [Deefgea piscis]